MKHDKKENAVKARVQFRYRSFEDHVCKKRRKLEGSSRREPVCWDLRRNFSSLRGAVDMGIVSLVDETRGLLSSQGLSSYFGARECSRRCCGM